MLRSISNGGLPACPEVRRGPCFGLPRRDRVATGRTNERQGGGLRLLHATRGDVELRLLRRRHQRPTLHNVFGLFAAVVINLLATGLKSEIARISVPRNSQQALSPTSKHHRRACRGLRRPRLLRGRHVSSRDDYGVDVRRRTACQLGLGPPARGRNCLVRPPMAGASPAAGHVRASRRPEKAAEAAA